MSAVVLTGSSGALGSRVAARLAAADEVDEVIGLDVALDPEVAIPQREVDLLTADLSAHLGPGDVVIHTASVLAPATAHAAGIDVDLTDRVLAAAARAGVAHVVVVSSATVYGARPENPVPLTEDAAVDPNPGFGFAEAKARIEALVERFRVDTPGVTVSVLRPTTTLAEQDASWVSAALLSAAGVRAGDLDPPVQFLHFDDLAAATVLVALQQADGAFNVAPDGWIPPDAMRALAGAPRPRVPVAIADRLATARWRLGLSDTPPQILPWTMYPWVVANDRLRALGWEQTHTNEEAYVEGTAPGPLDTLSPQRRQELAIGVAAAGIAAAGLGTVALLRRLRRR